MSWVGEDAALEDMVLSEVHVGTAEATAAVVSQATLRMSTYRFGGRWGGGREATESGRGRGGRGGGRRGGSAACVEAAAARDARQGGRGGAGGAVSSDEDGDLDVPRPAKRPRGESEAPASADAGAQQQAFELRVLHRLATPLAGVGAQLWRGAFLLCDFIMGAPASVRARWRRGTVLELGAGVGVCALLLSSCAGTVIATDTSRDALTLAARNAALNPHVARRSCVVKVRRLSWSEPLPGSRDAPHAAADGTAAADDPYQWSDEDIHDLHGVSDVFAADCIYDDTATAALVSCVTQLFALAAAGSRRAPTLWMAMERRVNFEVSEMAAVPHGYRRLWTLVCRRAGCCRGACGKALAAERLPVDARALPQRCGAYERVPELELWKVVPHGPADGKGRLCDAGRSLRA